ncbi:hypothetical protein LIER_01935 [Lithospermum erythrorhizon]|uniref:Uncharacterized protein n=1 Tax=Lithospermum erythrorhizon TaxID=34254 RepID=A0AAV3NNF7_LITER
MEANLASRTGVNTRAQSVVGRREDKMRPSTLADPPKKNSKISRMEPSKGARADTRPLRRTKEQENVDVRTRDFHVHSHERPRQNSPHQLVPSVGNYRQPKEDRRHQKKDFPPEPSTRRKAGGSGNAGLQKQVDEIRTLLKGITPGRRPVKHSTLLSFSSRLRKAMMPRGFRMPKFKTFSGFGDPGNHLKSFDSQLSFWASDDEVYARAFPSSLSGAGFEVVPQITTRFHRLLARCHGPIHGPIHGQI